MEDRCNRSPTFLNVQQSNKSDNASRQSRREHSLERTRLPIYRRSKSALSIISSGKQFEGGRSSSAIRNRQTPFVDTAQKSGSQKPGSSNKYLTPLDQQKRQGLVGTSNRLTGSKLSPWLKHSGNKETQKKEMAKELIRIRQILACINCNIQLTNPLPLRDFVNILINIFDALKMKSQLTFANYITAVPIIMKKMHYTGNCSTSMLKTVNTMHSWPHVLGVFSYLCDAIEAQYDLYPHETETNPIANIFRKSVCKFVMAEDASRRSQLYSEYVAEVIESCGIDMKNLKKKKDEEVELLRNIDLEQARFNKLQIDYNTRKKQEEDIEKELCKIKDQSERDELDDVHELEAMKREIQELDVQIAAASDKELLQKEQLKKQVYSKEDVAQLQQEINDLEETCHLQGERNKKLDIEWNSICLEQSKLQGKLKAIAMDFNVNLKTMYSNSSELQGILVPESGFSRYTKENMDSIMSNCLTTFSTVHERISDYKRKINEAEKECDEGVFVLNNLKSDIVRIKSEKNHELELRKREKQGFDHELEELEMKLQKKRDITLSLLDKKERLQKDLKEYTEVSVKLDGKVIEMENIFKHNKESADEAISQALLDVAKFMQKYEKEYRAHVEEKNLLQNKIDELKKSFR